MRKEKDIKKQKVYDFQACKIQQQSCLNGPSLPGCGEHDAGKELRTL